MNNLKQIQQLRKLHLMIKQEATGNPKMVAKKMHVSERQVYNLIDQLRAMDASVCFNRRTNTYYYSNDFELLVNISVKVIHGEEVLNISAGSKREVFFVPARFVQCPELPWTCHDTIS